MSQCAFELGMTVFVSGLFELRGLDAGASQKQVVCHATKHDADRGRRHSEEGRVTQDQYCLPDPILPPPPSLKMGSVVPRAPPSVLSTMPNLGCTTRTPASRAGCAAASHSLHTPDRNMVPGSLSSVSNSLPLSP